jgi:NCS2 family nucleobase:cation symporter-2
VAAWRRLKVPKRNYCQKLNDADWKRPDMRSISRGVLADGLATVSAGVVGTTGVNSATMNVGLANATGVLSRHVAYAVAGFLVLLAFMPKLGALLNLMPPAVAGSTLLFAASFIIVNGFEIMTSRLLDARKTFMIGLCCGGGRHRFLPSAFRALPAWSQSFVSSSLCSTLRHPEPAFRSACADASLPAGHIDPETLEKFMDECGAAWGARRDVIERAKFNLVQSIETILSSGAATGPLEVDASFDEFDVDVRVSYDGPPLELPEKRPSNEEIMASEEGERKLAGFILRKFADRVSVTHKGGRTTILFHFDH